ncbi:MAG: hypothetical protein JW849_01375, partial [Phycisphaerae bacterium]|nr:hypothetical protein [Phycisphaerae bacterium]
PASHADPLVYCAKRPHSSKFNPLWDDCDLKSQISDIHSLAESCSRQIRGWADHLQNTDIQGQRRLNAKTRRAWDQQKSTDAFMEKLQQIRDASADANRIPTPSPRQNSSGIP